MKRAVVPISALIFLIVHPHGNVILFLLLVKTKGVNLNDYYLSEEKLDNIIANALKEYTGHGDITSELLIPPDLQGKAFILVKKEGVLAGIEVAARVLHYFDPVLRVDILIKDGSRIKPGDVVGYISGSVRSLLKAERVTLNFLQRMSGIASQTAEFVETVKGLRSVIVDTRKTTPGLRMLEKYAVRMGGGQNHRLHLSDAILIKDNHVLALRALGLTLEQIVRKAKEKAMAGLVVEVEVSSVEDALEVAKAGADMIMLDNMNIEEMRRAVNELPGHVKIEASGGVNLHNVRAIAETGVDLISIGALTHSTKSLDISIELEPQTLKLF